ncbi:hypothetical protein [Ensifer sesbaniae]|uniref:hypothetical protein n=1 Tax=Ensifer sesbaniae TaxID=1214071 RepID=UPI00156919D4|nr:hypothetical protein [Ensifer sesbaniae]NRQ15313.1 hypothetical protein [Ensifer sesbaniae]
MWKFFAALTCVLTAGAFIWLALLVSGHIEGEFGLRDLISMIMSVPTTIGLVCYAYDRIMLPSAFWPPFAKMLTLWTAFEIVDTTWALLSLSPAAFARSKLAAVVVLYPVLLAFAYFGWLGVWRYAHAVKRQSAPAN